jgi:hypothetical protein
VNQLDECSPSKANIISPYSRTPYRYDLGAKRARSTLLGKRSPARRSLGRRRPLSAVAGGWFAGWRRLGNQECICVNLRNLRTDTHRVRGQSR